MASSPDDVLMLLANWKKAGNMLAILFRQKGQVIFSANGKVIDVSAESASFSFELNNSAGGTLSVPLSFPTVADAIDPSDPPFFGPYPHTDFEACIQFKWPLHDDWCIVCAHPKA